MIDQKLFRKDVSDTMKAINNACSINVQNVDSGTHAFVNVDNIKVSWGKREVLFFIPHTVTYRIPYDAVCSYSVYGQNTAQSSMEIELKGRQLMSIRPKQ